MGGSSSVLNCSKTKKKDKYKKRKRGKPIEEPSQSTPNKTLQNDIEAYETKVDELRNQGSEVTKRVNPLDKELVEDQIKKREKKFGDVRAKSERAQKGFEVLELDLEEIQGKVDQYVAWLKKKEEQIQLTQPQGYQVSEAEANMHYINGLCSELENRQFTLDTVNKKVESVLPDLTPKDREEMEHSIKSLSTEHNRVYGLAVQQKDMLADALNAREVFQVGLDRVNLWLEEREEKITNLERHRLLANDVEKQMEKAKSLMLEIEKYEPNIEQVGSRVQTLQQDCNTDQCTELDEKVTDVQKKFSDLQQHMKTVHEKLQTGLAARKVHEADLQKVERWCKEADMKCAVQPSLDCATEILEEQYKQYKTLDTSARMFESLLNEIEDRAQGFLPFLTEADTTTLQQTTKAAHDKFDRLSKTIKERVKSIDEALQTRDQVDDGIQEANDWIAGTQDDLKQIQRTVGPTVNDAEDVLKQYENVAEKLANYQPTIAQLNQAVERLRSLGQLSEADEILRITSQYEMLSDQVRQQTRKCQQAVSSRQQLENQMKDIDNLVKECEDSTDSVIGLQVPVPEKIEKLKAVSTKLQSAGPMLFAMGDRAQQIGIEGTSTDAQAVSNMTDDIKARVDDLKKIADRKTKQCESIQKNREDFESSVNETMNWLDTKEEMLASCTSLDLDPTKVKSSLQKHQALKKEFTERLSQIRSRAEVNYVVLYNQYFVPLP